MVEALEGDVFVLGLDHEEHADFGCALADHADVNVVISKSPAGCGRHPDIFPHGFPDDGEDAEVVFYLDGVRVEFVLNGL